jgi:hypothetical protein
MYDKPNRQKYSFRFDAGNNGNETFSIFGPKGKTGRLVDYGCEGITEAFTADCTIEIGDGSDADKYGKALAMGTTAADAVKSVRTSYDPSKDQASYDALIVEPNIPADGKVCMTITDDAAAGIGNFFVIVDWDN